jgi:hypothetical protein
MAAGYITQIQYESAQLVYNKEFLQFALYLLVIICRIQYDRQLDFQ